MARLYTKGGNLLRQHLEFDDYANWDEVSVAIFEVQQLRATRKAALRALRSVYEVTEGLPDPDDPEDSPLIRAVRHYLEVNERYHAAQLEMVKAYTERRAAAESQGSSSD